ncbi:phospholipid-binding lipoprotein MlaA [Arsukibacterium tuosuense]|uniref:Phospholipid-binding lipoprotein MlaA n=1 Tax=Arsukibacterium tuosuense TaxID=1323745 RepID=A0A285J489_9GAMM|nr:VacJ family lipoprotein [Arsukibacterium tuosuense]SNY54873.1 phospholipid-binding lipoprotein MlaA [Arsukibacterium tuosuense]
MNHRYTLIWLLAAVLAGCAAKPEPTASAAASEDRSVSSSQADKAKPEDNEPTAAEQLSAGQTTKVETSQGTLELEPTVVDMEPVADDSAAAEADGAADAEKSASTPLYHDPLEGWNRAVFRFNHVSYTYVLIPVAKGYEKVLPAPVRDKVGNAFANIREPLNLVNNALTGDFKGAGSNLGRFLINSTIGILGLFDPATAWFDIAKSKQSIADTLSHYQVGNGPYLVLPILGQSDVRGASSVLGEAFLHPLNQLVGAPDAYYLQGVNVINSFSDRANLYQTLYKQADDPYIYFRNQHLQGLKRDEAYVKPE